MRFSIFLKFICVIFVGFLLTSCNDIDLCYYDDDFGGNGNRDLIYVYSSESLCYFDVTSKYDDESQSITVKNCLEKTVAKSVNDSNWSDYKEYIKSITDLNGKIISDNLDESLCYHYDPYTYNVEYNTKKDGATEALASAYQTSIYEECANYCSTQCENNGNELSPSKWTKANFKTSNSYLGIALSDDSYVYITVSGEVFLTGSNEGTVAEYNTIGLNDTNYSSYTPSGSLTLNIDYHKDNINGHFGDISAFKARTVLTVEDADNNLIYNNDDNTEYYQKPLYSYLKCNYNKIDNTDDYYSTNCRFNVSDNETINNYYNNTYDVPLVFNSQYYAYASDTLNKVTTLDDNGAITELSGSGEIVENKYITLDGNKLINKTTKLVEGYLWNNFAKPQAITIAEPAKIAIKYIDNGKCSSNQYEYKLTVSDEKVYEYDNSNDNIKNVTGSYDITYTTTGYSDSKWQVLKKDFGSQQNPDKREIIFNQFSTAYRSINSDIEFNLSKYNGNVPDGCKQALIIKIIYLKDYLIKDSGLLFFDFNNVEKNNNDSITYEVINPNVIYNYSSLEDKERGIDDFLESSDTSSKNISKFNGWETVKTVTASDIGYIDSNEFDSNLLLKSIFVKKGQVVRFDYSNWLELDDKTKITLKQNKYTFSNYNISKSLSLVAVMQKRPAYFCVGKYKDRIDKETGCISQGGSFEEITIDSDEINVCYIEPNECVIDAELIEEYNSISFITKNDNGTIKTTCSKASSNSNSISTNLKDFLVNIFYQNYTSVEDNVKNDYIMCYKDIIKKIYDKALNCSKALVNNGEYQFYKRTINDKNNKYDEINDKTVLKEVALTNEVKDGEGNITNINVIKEDIDKMVKNIEDFFEINMLDKYEMNGNTYYSYTSLLYYYKDIYGSICDSSSGSVDNNEVCLSINEVPMCYNLENYEGSISNFIDKTLKSSGSTTIDLDDIRNYGIMSSDNKTLGAKRINEFSGVSGLIQNFIIDTDNEPTDSNYSRLKYDDNIYLNGPSFINIYMLKTVSKVSDIKNSFINEDVSNLIRLQKDVKVSYTNGANLAVMVGENKINDNDVSYYTRAINSDSLSNYYESADGQKEIIVTDAYDELLSKGTLNNANNNGKYILGLVKYNAKGKLSDSSPFKFDSDGNLVGNAYSPGSTGVDFSTFAVGKEYIKSNNKSDKNLYFRIVDMDNTISNNSGNYKITIKEYNDDSENFIVTYFRKFFNNILNFIDGAYINIAKNKTSDQFVFCKGTDTKCYIYNETDVNSNGDSCKADTSNCYKGCDVLDYSNEKCVSVYNGKGFVKTVYEKFINDPLYILVAKISLILAITWYGFGYFLGMSNFKQKDIITRIIRFCFIYFIISPSGWNFFNNYIIYFFKNGIDNVLFLIAGSFESDLGSELTQAISSGNYTDKTLLFSGSFSNLEMIFSDSVFNKILGLAFSGWVGLIYLYLVFSAIISYVVAVLTSIIMYLSAQVYMSLVFCFFPLVVLFMFFEKTKKTFDNWLNILIGFAGQQIFLVITLSFFNLLIYNFIKNTFNYTVCWMSIFSISIGGIPLAAIQFWKIPSASMASSGLNTTNEGMPSFYSIITFYMIGILMGKFITEMTSLGNTLFGGSISIGDGMAGKAIKAVEKVQDDIKGKMKETGKAFYSESVDRLGGKAIKSFGENQNKEIQDRRKSRHDYFKKVRDNTNEEMEKYKKGDFNKEKENIRKEAMKNAVINNADTRESIREKMTMADRARLIQAGGNKEKQDAVLKDVFEQLDPRKQAEILGKLSKEEVDNAQKSANKQAAQTYAQHKQNTVRQAEQKALDEVYGSKIKEQYIKGGGTEEGYESDKKNIHRQFAMNHALVNRSKPVQTQAQNQGGGSGGTPPPPPAPPPLPGQGS